MEHHFYNELLEQNSVLAETLQRLQREMQQVTYVPEPIKSNFGDLSPEDILYEVIERKNQVSIVRRKVERVQRIGKKIHFVLYPYPDSENQAYFPYSNRNWTMSKKFNPIFIYYDDAICWIYDKLRKDEEHCRYLLDNIRNKRAYIDNLVHRDILYNSIISTAATSRDSMSSRYATYVDASTSPISNHSGVVFM